ncbi:MAG: hypothetical protein ACE5GX_10815 [Thermoanaerobaculia bacterium]
MSARQSSAARGRRESWSRSLEGSIHFEDYRDIDDVMVAFKSTVTLPPSEETVEPLDDNYFHQIIVDSTSFDGFDPAELVVEVERAELGDAKP